jgi:methionyl aminopeptidase
MPTLTEEDIRSYIRAGWIASRVKERAAKEVKPGARMLDVANSLESYIVELGGMPAFPVNISINSEAAHRTAYLGEESIIPEESVVKVDIGVHVNGFIADTAITLDFSGRMAQLVEAVNDALEKALKYVKPGVRVSDVGALIERAIRSKGFKVVRNLSGHSLDRYVVHAGETIPNYRETLNLSRFRTSSAYAIEPFASTGRGLVSSEKRVYIYAVRRVDIEQGAREVCVLENVYMKVRTLPFTERWFPELVSELGLQGFRETLSELVKQGYLIAYPVLSDVPGSYVAQAEETVLILDDGSTLVITSKGIRS